MKLISFFKKGGWLLVIGFGLFSQPVLADEDNISVFSLPLS